MGTKAQQQRLERLAHFIKTRRLELGLDQGGLRSRGGPSIVSVGKLERADTPNPLPSTLDRVDVALGWERGSSAAILAGRIEKPDVQQGVPDVQWGRTDVNPVIAAIEADPYLLPEARAHFLNQYELLLRVQRTSSEPALYAAHGRRTEPVDAEHEAELEALARAAAKGNRHSPGRKQ